MHIQPVLDAIEQILPEYPEGLSEFELIRQLQQPPYSLLADDALRENLDLFQTHFLVFHCLYQLRRQYLEQQVWDLHIDALKIQLLPWQPGQAALTHMHSLADYYLDWQNLKDTDREQVEMLLDNFWQKLAGQVSDEDKSNALRTLELPDNADSIEIKQQYRRLMHLHHPDKGGDGKKAQDIEKAYRCLKPLLS